VRLLGHDDTSHYVPDAHPYLEVGSDHPGEAENA